MLFLGLKCNKNVACIISCLYLWQWCSHILFDKRKAIANCSNGFFDVLCLAMCLFHICCMKNFLSCILLFCIGLCSLVNVANAQETDENTSSEKSALLIQAGCVMVVGAGNIDAAAVIAKMHVPVADYVVLVNENEAPKQTEVDAFIENLIAISRRTCDLQRVALIDDDIDDLPELTLLPLLHKRQGEKLYNEFQNFKARLTDNFYQHRFSC